MYRIVNITNEDNEELVRFENNKEIFVEDSFKDFFYKNKKLLLSYEIDDKSEIFADDKIDVINKVNNSGKTSLYTDKYKLEYNDYENKDNCKYVYHLDKENKKYLFDGVDEGTKKIYVNCVSDSLDKDKDGIFVVEGTKKIYLYSNKGRLFNNRK